MSKLGLSERVRVAVLRAQGFQRQTTSSVLQNRLLRWRFGAGSLGQLVIVPQCLRPCDPSFWAEIESGSFGLSGNTTRLDGRSPFDVPAPGRAWQANLHGFSWLRHLEAAEDHNAQRAGRGYVLDWLKRPSLQRGSAARPAVRARRIISWITHAPFLLDGASAHEFDAICRGIAREVAALAGTWRNAGEGYARLLALTALVVAYLSVQGKERQLEQTLRQFVIELERQMHSDGGHLSRSPATLIDLLLDLLPLKSCFDTRDLTPPDGFTIAIQRMLIMLRYLRLGDGGIARHNGTGLGDPAAMATLTAHDDRPLPDWGIAPQSRYARLEAGAAVVIADGGGAPPLAMSGLAHAGCLSFEMSTGHTLLFVNAGTPGSTDSDWRAVARATASHSTVCVGETSSARLVRNAALEAMLGAVPLQMAATVTATVTHDEVGHVFEGAHDGYLQRHGLVHHRQLRLSADGNELEGRDRLETKAHDRLRRDVPFAIHFHLHPDTICEQAYSKCASECALVIRLRNGQRWLFRATGAAASIEESIFFTGSSGPRPSSQIVLRGASAGVTDVRWSATLEQDIPASLPGL